MNFRIPLESEKLNNTYRKRERATVSSVSLNKPELKNNVEGIRKQTITICFLKF